MRLREILKVSTRIKILESDPELKRASAFQKHIIKLKEIKNSTLIQNRDSIESKAVDKSRERSMIIEGFKEESSSMLTYSII